MDCHLSKRCYDSSIKPYGEPFFFEKEASYFLKKYDKKIYGIHPKKPPDKSGIKAILGHRSKINQIIVF